MPRDRQAYSRAGCAQELVLGALEWEMAMPLIPRERDEDGVRLEDCSTSIVVGSGAAHGWGDPGRFPSAPWWLWGVFMATEMGCIPAMPLMPSWRSVAPGVPLD